MQIADFSGVDVVSDAGGDATYGLGATIRVRLSFSEAVEVEGAPQLRIDMDPAHWGRKWAVYESGSGTADLLFAYEVVQPNQSTRGIAVLANTLELNGGAIKSTAAGACSRPLRFAHSRPRTLPDSGQLNQPGRGQFRQSPLAAGSSSVLSISLPVASLLCRRWPG